MESFVLIKPDAVYNKVLRRIIITEIQNKNIKITNSEVIMLNQEEVDIFWPKSKKSVVLNGLLKCYLTMKQSEVLFLEGDFNDEVLNEIKYKIRKKYAICKLKNCMHTPENESERILQLNYLNERTKSDEGNVNVGINPISKKIWGLIGDYGWNHDFAHCRDNKYMLYLKDDNFNSIDHVANTVSCALKNYSIEVAYILALQAEMNGRVLIASFDKKEEYLNIKEKFSKMNINVDSNMLFNN